MISKKHYCIFIAVCLTSLIGLRNEMMGMTDTYAVYLRRFSEISHYGFEYALTLKDTGFQIVTFLFIKMFGEKPTLYLLFMAVPYVTAVTYLIYKYSDSPMLSFIAFLSLQFFEISFTLMRQVVAMAILVLAFRYVIEKKPIKFIISIVFAYFFHQVAIVFLVVYPLSKIRNKNIYLALIAGTYISTILFPQHILKVIGMIQESNERYGHVSNELNTNLVYFFICLVFILVGLLYFKGLKKSEVNYLLFKMSALATALAPLTIVVREFSRISYLFALFNIILLPNAIAFERDSQTKVIIITFSIIIFMVYFLFFLGPETNVIPYKFFWE